MNSKETRRRIDLKKIFPISDRLLLRMVLPWVLALAGARLLLFFAETAPIFPSNVIDEAAVRAACYGLSFALAVISAARFFAYVLYTAEIRYSLVNEDRVEIVRGVFRRKIGSYPLSGITEVYVIRSGMDMLFGLARLELVTPAMREEEFARIEGLDKKTATRLQRVLFDAIRAHACEEGAHKGGLQGGEGELTGATAQTAAA